MKHGVGQQYESARYFSNQNDQQINNNTFTGLFKGQQQKLLRTKQEEDMQIESEADEIYVPETVLSDNEAATGAYRGKHGIRG